MEKTDANETMLKLVAKVMSDRLKFVVFGLLLLPLAGANANGNNNISISHRLSNDDAVAEFKTQLYSWQETQGDMEGLEVKLDRRFKPEHCPGSYSFEMMENSKNLVRAECHAPKWSRVLKASRRKSSSQNRQTDQVWVAATSVATGELITQSHVKKISIDSRKIPRNALRAPPSGSSIAKRALRSGEIILTNSIYEPTYGYVAKTTIPSGALLKPELISKKLIKGNFKGEILENARGIEFMAANRNILAGNPIRSRDLRKARLVRRGDQVKLVSAGGGFVVSSKTIALEDGYLDEQIRLLGEDGKKEIRAKISGISSAIALK